MSRDAPDYCRALEAYLCRKNDGHLVRIVGPAFERVCSWAERGVPLKVAYRGIDRYFERYYAKGPRRRPVRIEFCEADVMDVFDEWKRAVGVFVVRETRSESTGAPADTSAYDGSDTEETGAATAVADTRRGSLPAHLDRVVTRLRALRDGVHAGLVPVLDDVTRQIDAIRADAKHRRGAARQDALDRLRALDDRLLAGARATLDTVALSGVEKEAEAELAPFRPRMPDGAYQRSMAACVDRIVRDRARLPRITFD